MALVMLTLSLNIKSLLHDSDNVMTMISKLKPRGKSSLPAADLVLDKSYNDSLYRSQSVKAYRFRPNADTAGMTGLIKNMNRYLSIRVPFSDDADDLCLSILLTES